MDEGFRIWANPSSPHAEGRKARAALEDARERIKAALGWDGELIFTSGASEAAALVFERSTTLHEITSTVEHDSVYLDEGVWSDYAPVGADGAVSLTTISARIEPPRVAEVYEDRSLVAVQHINSETGNRQDIGMAAEVTHDKQGLLLVDCAQSAGKFDIPMLADFAIISAHKFGGPIGIGALLVKDYNMLSASGGHERGYRRGTENLPAALGMAAALEACGRPYVASAVLEPLEELASECRAIGGAWLSDRLSCPTPYIRAVAMPNLSGSAQVMRFDLAGISVSQGSACSSGTMKTSRVLKAMQVDPDIADKTIRVSVGWDTTREDVERFCEVWLELAKA